MVAKTFATPLLGTHDCTRCSINQINREYMHILHIKAMVPNNTEDIVCANNTSVLWKRHKEFVRALEMHTK